MPEDKFPRDEEIVKLAYSLAVGTHRFQDMFDLLRARFDVLSDSQPTLPDDTNPDDAFQDRFAALEPHFENAKALMEAQGKRMDTATHSMKVIDANSHPSALLKMDGSIFYENKAAAEIFGLKRGQRPNAELFEPGHYRILMDNLRNIEKFDANKIISIFGMSNVDGDEMVKVALTKANASDGSIMGHISAINISWVSSRAKQFQALFGLTPVELEITKSVVIGVSLNDLAKKRGRSIGTVRNQTKMLLSKLNLRSQTELACLYSGFSEYSGGLSATLMDPEHASANAAKHALLIRENARLLDYSMAGPEKGTPLLFFPALLGGMTITEDMYQALCKHRIKLIMPWRPGLGESGIDNRKDPDAFAPFSADVAALMDELKIKQAPAIGHITTAMFAAAAACHMPDRISSVVCINGIVPTIRGVHVKLIEKRERMRMFLMRNAPKVGQMVMHAAMSLVDSGYDQEFMQVHLQNSPIDLETAEDDEIKQLFRADFRLMTKHGYDGFTQELALAASNWEHLISDCPKPIHNLVGEENVFFTPKVIESYSAQQKDYGMKIIPGTAHLALYQKPDLVLSMLREYI